MFSYIVVVVNVTHGFTFNFHDTGNIKLLVVCPMGTLNVSIFLAVPFMVLNQAASKSTDELP